MRAILMFAVVAAMVAFALLLWFEVFPIRTPLDYAFLAGGVVLAGFLFFGVANGVRCRIRGAGKRD